MCGDNQMTTKDIINAAIPEAILKTCEQHKINAMPCKHMAAMRIYDRKTKRVVSLCKSCFDVIAPVVAKRNVGYLNI